MRPSCRWFWSAVCLGAALSAAAATPRVVVIEDAPWSPADIAREGAAELGVLLQLAHLQRAGEPVGLVVVGDRRGALQEGARRALAFAARQGVPVVRLARGGRAQIPAEADDFIHGGALAPDEAVELLSRCLAHHGPLPAATERRAFAAQLRRYQAEFSARSAARFVTN